MSGGSYDYLCYKDASEVVGYETQIQAMADRLAKLGYAEDAALETTSVLLEIRQFKVRIGARLSRLNGVWNSVEWWDSCDTSEDGVKQALEAYRQRHEKLDQPNSGRGGVSSTFEDFMIDKTVKDTQRMADLMAERDTTLARVKELEGVKHHMDYCRSLLKTPNDDVLSESIKELQSQLHQRDTALVAARDVLKKWLAYESAEIPKDADNQEALAERFTEAWFETRDVLSLIDRALSQIQTINSSQIDSSLIIGKPTSKR